MSWGLRDGETRRLRDEGTERLGDEGKGRHSLLNPVEGTGRRREGVTITGDESIDGGEDVRLVFGIQVLDLLQFFKRFVVNALILPVLYQIIQGNAEGIGDLCCYVN